MFCIFGYNYQSVDNNCQVFGSLCCLHSNRKYIYNYTSRDFLAENFQNLGSVCPKPLLSYPKEIYLKFISRIFTMFRANLLITMKNISSDPIRQVGVRCEQYLEILYHNSVNTYKII